MCDREQQDGIRIDFEVNELVGKTGELINAGSVMVRRIRLRGCANRGNAHIEFGSEPRGEALTGASVPPPGVAGFINGSRVKFNCRHRDHP